MDRTDLTVPVFHQKRAVQSSHDRVQSCETATTGLGPGASVLRQERLSPEKRVRVLKSCELKSIGPSSAEPPAYRLSRTLMSLESELNPEKTSVPTTGLMTASIALDQPREIGELSWCRHCNSHVRSMERKVSSVKTCLASAGIFLLGGVFGCFLAPYCSDDCKDSVRYCTKCELMIN